MSFADDMEWNFPVSHRFPIVAGIILILLGIGSLVLLTVYAGFDMVIKDHEKNCRFLCPRYKAIMAIRE